MEENFILRIIAELNKVLSKKSINGTLRALDNTMYVKVLAKLSMTLARKQLKSQLKELNDLYVKVGANVNIDKNAKAQLQKNIQMLQQSISDLEIGLKTSKYQQNILFIKFYASTIFTLFAPIIHNFMVIMQILCCKFFKLFSNRRKQLYTQFEDR